MENLDFFKKKMVLEGLDEYIIKIFSYYYEQLCNGEKGKLSKTNITSPNENRIINYTELSDSETHILKKLAVIKLNGGLGTSMGLSKAKSLLPVKDKNTFLDIIVKQTLKMRDDLNINLPLLFMNSFSTSEDTINFLAKYPELEKKNIPLEFIQNKFPKVKQVDKLPLENPNNNLNWNPPGHGDIYGTLYMTGILDKLIEMGFDYVFVSNSDNLGAVVDPKILSKMVSENIDFLMEVCTRTENDKKGGHLAQSLLQASDKQQVVNNKEKLLLREIAQCPEEEIDEFQNIEKYKYFNTNNLWVNLSSLKKLIEKHNYILPLPLILNSKIVDNIPVYQIETAMGSAISLFDNAAACVVPRNRFLPVKKNQDLLLLWSDIYYLNDSYILTKKPNAKETILDLDESYYGKIQQLEEACNNGVPSLFHCNNLKIRGNIKFGPQVIFKGCVNITTKQDLYLEQTEISSG